MEVLRVLIVEDEVIIAKDIENKLRKLGHTTVGNVIAGEDVLPAAMESRPDLVLMDIWLRGQMDGIDAAHLLRARLDIPVIYITSHSDDHILERAKRTEPAGYILKPIESRDLATTIQMALYKHRAEKERRRQMERQNVMRQIDHAILTQEGLNQILDTVLSQTVTYLQIDAAAALLVNPFSQTLEAAVALGLNAAQRPLVRLGEGITGAAALKRERAHLADLLSGAPDNGLAWAVKAGFKGYLALPLVCKGQLRGVLEVFQRSLLHPEAEWLDVLEAIGDQAAIAIENMFLLEELRASNLNLIQAYDTTIMGWSKALELRNLETHGHCERVVKSTLELAQAMGISGVALDHIRRGALLHDIGKMGIPDQILLKPGPLTPQERDVVRRHTEYARQLLEPIPFLHPALDIPLHHHEKWDGTGYPDHLKGEEIPLTARIFAVVDVWDALRFERLYHEAWPETEVLEYLRQESGYHFDPRVVEVFLRLREKNLMA